MNRAESAVFVERGIHSASYDPPTPSSQIFADMPLDSWAAKWVNGAVAGSVHSRMWDESAGLLSLAGPQPCRGLRVLSADDEGCELRTSTASSADLQRRATGCLVCEVGAGGVRGGQSEVEGGV
jgi:hypothetical protein